MDDAALGIAVVVLLALAVLAAVVYDLRSRSRRPDAVSEQALRRARGLDALHQPPQGPTFPP